MCAKHGINLAGVSLVMVFAVKCSELQVDIRNGMDEGRTSVVTIKRVNEIFQTCHYICDRF